MEENMFVFMIVMLTIMPIVLIIAFGFWWAKKRREAIQRVASELLFSYDARPIPDPHLDHPDMKLFNVGHSRRSSNLMRGIFQGIDLVVFDYHYAVGGGKHTSHYTQTVVIARIPDLDMPYFTLGPESFFHKIGDWFGKKDIDFPFNKEFSDRYLLKGDDEIRIGMVFKTHILDHFENRPEKDKINIEAKGERIIVFRSGRTVKSDDLKEHIINTTSLVKILSDS